VTTTPEDYLDLPYHITLVHDRSVDGDEGWVAEVQELGGCLSQGRTPDEAIARVKDAMLGWISVALEDGHEVPPPREDVSYSGRVLLRMPKTLHGILAAAAERDGVSLNQYMVAALAYAAGLSAPSRDRHDALAQR